MLGRKIGHYRVVAKVGEGGMGEVYRAHDTRLDREVALKVLPEAFARNAERMARFEREARLLASLNHPNIASIYGLEEDAAVRCLVLELVEGETLAERLDRGALPMEETLGFAKQIADALEAAHERGIIHRDLKPSNVKVTRDGTVKVLDFGLAKALSEDAPPVDASKSPTISELATQGGVVLGTAGYMSPEQARGKPVDKKADIWAFGCVLYEMLTGERAFGAGTVTDTLAAVLRAEPDWTALPPQTPEQIRQLLRRCLEKEPKKRLHDIADARLELEDSLTAPLTAPRSVIAQPQRAWRRLLPWALTALTAVVALGLFVWGPAREAGREERVLRSSILPPPNVSIQPAGTPAISPDGRKLALVGSSAGGKQQIWVRPLEGLAAQALAGTDDAIFPFWSPDSRSIAFFAEGRLKKVEAAGGAVQTICEAGWSRGGTWGEDGTILFSPGPEAPLFRVSAAGGEPKPLTALNKAQKETSHRWPFFLPDGRHFVFRKGYEGPVSLRGTLAAGSLDGKTQDLGIEADSQFVFSPTGHLLFVRKGTLFAQAFDAKKLTVAGEAIPIAEQVGQFWAAWGNFSVSANGILAYQPASQQQPPSQLAWMSRDGGELGVLGDKAYYLRPRISPDGSRVSVGVVSAGAEGEKVDLWVYEVARGIRSRVTFGGSASVVSAWSPDGKQIAFFRNTKPQGVYVTSSGWASEEKILAPADSDHSDPDSPDWSADGRYIVFDEFNEKTKHAEIRILALFGEGKVEALRQGPFDQGNAVVSPDCHWLAYNSDESGRDEVYVVPFPKGEGGWQVSTTGGHSARWRRDGREIYYLTEPAEGRMKVMAAEVSASSSGFHVGLAKPLFEFAIQHWQSYDVSGDGQRFLVVKAPETGAPPPITLVVNWPAALKR